MATRHRRSGEAWINRYWRPIAAMTYIVICLFDFLFAPILLGLYSFYMKQPLVTWVPLTTQGGSIFHLSFGAFIGSYSYSHGKENMQRNEIQAGINNKVETPNG
jgi:hypothetical protein